MELSILIDFKYRLDVAQVRAQILLVDIKKDVTIAVGFEAALS